MCFYRPCASQNTHFHVKQNLLLSLSLWGSERVFWLSRMFEVHGVSLITKISLYFSFEFCCDMLSLRQYICYQKDTLVRVAEEKATASVAQCYLINHPRKPATLASKGIKEPLTPLCFWSKFYYAVIDGFTLWSRSLFVFTVFSQSFFF